MPKRSLRALDAAAIVAAICAAAERWSDADFPPRIRVARAIEARLGYRAPVVEYALDRAFAPLRVDALRAAIVDELGSLAALDGFVDRAGRPAAFARGVERVVVIASNSTIGVALLPAVFALCAKCEVVVKDRSDGLCAAFFATLIEEDAAFGAAQARAWIGGDDPAEGALLGGADVVVAFGADPALRAIRARLRADARFVPFGPRASIGFVAAADALGADGSALLERIAVDALLYDGDGCLSLHALFAAGERDAVREVGARLAAAVERVSIEFPPGSVEVVRATAAGAYRRLGAFRAAGGRGAVFVSADGSASVVFDPPREEPPPFLPRTLPVFPVAGPDDVVAYVQAHRLPLEALGVADPRAPEAARLGERVGAVRIARLGELQSPPVAGHHGGTPRIADFVRWIDRA